MKRLLSILIMMAAGSACVSRDAVDAPLTLSIPGHTNSTPWVAAAGNTVAVAWGASADGRTDVYVAVSRDGGRTFAGAIAVDTSGTARLSGEMPPRVAVREVSGGDIEMSVVWVRRIGDGQSVMLSRSSDGRSFGPPVALQAPEARGPRGWPALALDREGAPHAVWLDHRGLAGSTHVHGQPSTEDGAARAQKSSIYYAPAPGREQEIAKGVCYCCKTALAATPRGDLYAAWRHVYPGNLRDMAFSAAHAGGAFNPPTRVSEDHWQINGCPDDGPAMAVDANGAAHIVWPTVVPGDQPRGAIFYAMTSDAHNFTERVAVPTLGGAKPSHPQIAVDAAGTMFIAWDELAGEKRVVAARSARRDRNGTLTFGEVIRLAEGASYYPVLAAAGDRFVAVWANAGDNSSIGVRRIRE